MIPPGSKSSVWHYFGFPAKEGLRRACDHSCVLFAINLDYWLHSLFYSSILLATCNTSCGFAVNSSYRNIIDYCDKLVRILQNIAIIFFGYRTGLSGYKIQKH